MCSIVLDVNECLLPDACSVHTACKNTDGSYRCECPPGFSQDSSSQNDSNPVCNGEKLKVTLKMLCPRVWPVAGRGGGNRRYWLSEKWQVLNRSRNNWSENESDYMISWGHESELSNSIERKFMGSHLMFVFEWSDRGGGGISRVNTFNTPAITRCAKYNVERVFLVQ